jgi:hypothetical protein
MKKTGQIPQSVTAQGDTARFIRAIRAAAEIGILEPMTPMTRDDYNKAKQEITAPSVTSRRWKSDAKAVAE